MPGGLDLSICDLMSGPALRALAQHYQGLADQLAGLASLREAEECAAESRRRRKTRLRRVYEEAEALREAGRSTEDALAELAWQHGATAEAIRAWYAQGERLAARLERRRRDREIARLARAGLTNAEIAQRVGLHPKTVQRILRTAFAGAPAAGAPSPSGAAARNHSSGIKICCPAAVTVRA